MMKLSQIGLYLSVLMFHGTLSSANEANMTDSKSMYTVNIESQGGGCELFINDIPVLSSEYPFTISKFLINPWLITGRNTFTIRMVPVDSATKNHPQWTPTARLCKVVISGPEDNGAPTTTLAEAEVKTSESDPPLSKGGSFTVTLGYPTPAWAQSQKIGRDATSQKKILDKYREFHRLLEKKDLDGIMKFSAAKFKEYSKSLYDPDFESDRKNSFQEEFETPPGTLLGIDVQLQNGLRYEYYHGDRLVSIKNDEDRSIIQYYDEDEGATTEYPLFFYFYGKDFVLIF